LLKTYTFVYADENSFRYTIQVATYANNKHAHALVEKLTQKGYKNVYVKSSNHRFYYVCLGNFKNKEDAKKELEKIKKKGFKDSFIKLVKEGYPGSISSPKNLEEITASKGVKVSEYVGGSFWMDGAEVRQRKNVVKNYLKGKNDIDDIAMDDFLAAIKMKDCQEPYLQKCDLDNDGQAEILLSRLDGHHNANNFVIDLDKKQGKWEMVYFDNCSDHFDSIILDDINKDGYVEMIYSNLHGAGSRHAFAIYRYKDNAVLKIGPSDYEGPMSRWGKIEIKDIDNDGIKEIIYEYRKETVDFEKDMARPIKIACYKWNGEEYYRLWCKDKK